MAKKGKAGTANTRRRRTRARGTEARASHGADAHFLWPNDINLAAIRYYANEIEQVSLSAYAASGQDPWLFNELGRCVKRIRAHFKQKQSKASAGKCWDRWVLCSDGMCHPPDEC